MSAPPMLQRTRFLDFDHPEVATFVREHTRGAETPAQKAAQLFVAVRDGIPYDALRAQLAPERLTASATVAESGAFCVPKAVLYAASLRAVGIGARLGFADVTNHLATPRLIEFLRTDVFAFHGYVEVHLEGRVLKATPTFDAALCARFGVSPLQFDGTSDAMLQAFDSQGRRFMQYVRDRGVYDDLPYAEMVRAWKETYPHLYGATGASVP